MERRITGQFTSKKQKVTNLCNHCGIVTRNASYCTRTCYNAAKVAASDLLVEQGKAASHIVKKYLIRKHGNRCLDPSCAWDFTKRDVPVQMDHRDGDSSNNTLSNCTLLCPNCHSLTPTYGAKNKGNGPISRRLRYQADKLRF